MSAIIPLANAYPSQVMSVPGLLAMTLVIVGLLAVWLSLVFYAGRQPRRRQAEHAHASPPEDIEVSAAEHEEAPTRSAGPAAGAGRPAGGKAA